MRLLHVEDNPLDADLTRRRLALDLPGASVESAVSLADAHAQLAFNGAFDLMMCDVGLPDGSGIQLVSEIRRQGSPMAVVMLTGDGDVDTVVAALKAGADDYVIKGTCSATPLGKLLSDAIARRRESSHQAVSLRVLHVQPDVCEGEVRRHLELHAPHVRLERVADAEPLLQQLARGSDDAARCDVLLLECRAGGDATLAVLKALLDARRFHVPLVMLGEEGDRELATFALRLGADVDYLVKHNNYLQALPATLENAHRKALLARERAALRDAQARLAAVVESALDGFISIDAEQRVLLFNPAAETMFRCPRSEAIGQHIATFIPARFRERHAERIRDFGRTSGSRRMDTPFRTIYGLRRDGTEFPLEASISKVSAAGADFYTVILRDVTERVVAEEHREELEAQLRQSQKMDAIGRLAGGVAHDFNNMLNVILGHAELGLRRTQPDDPLRRNLEQISAAGQRSAALTRQLLAFSRRQPIAPRVLDLNAQVLAMQGLLQRMLGEDVDLRFALAPELWRVCADPGQLDQVLANLAGNARDALLSGGLITVRTANVEKTQLCCGDGHPGEHVLLSVSDTGVGMDPQTAERAFEPFFTTKGEGHGTGLGLATVYGIARQNGGCVSLHSVPGQGTTVEFYLPRYAGGTASDADPSLGEQPQRGHESVLLVEDEDAMRDLASELLRELGYSVHVAPGPSAALALCADATVAIDLLLTDVVMPEMSGKELADRARRLRPRLRVLYTSGYTANVIAQRGVLEPGVELLEKPFSLESLGAKVRQMLSAPG